MIHSKFTGILRYKQIIPISASRPDIVIVDKNKENLPNRGLCLPGGRQSKIKEGEKINKYVDLVRELKQLRNLKVTVLPIVSGALGIIPKSLIKRMDDLEIRGHV